VKEEYPNWSVTRLRKEVVKRVSLGKVVFITDCSIR
jgi:hypothetical protein